MDNLVLSTIMGRASVRRFEDRPVPREPVSLLLCLDLRKLELLIAHQSRSNQADDLSMLILGIQDVAYAGQNMVLAAESLGLGSVFLGAARARPWSTYCSGTNTATWIGLRSRTASTSWTRASCAKATTASCRPRSR
ncbi:MAG: hypothetical protein AB1492_04905 [Bacillota bacterium]